MTKLNSLLFLALASLALSCGGGDAPRTAQAFCTQQDPILCDKLFQCVPEAARDATFVGLFGSTITECKGKISADCADANAMCPKYNSASAKACLDKIAPLTCAQIGDIMSPPAECDQACP